MCVFENTQGSEYLSLGLEIEYWRSMALGILFHRRAAFATLFLAGFQLIGGVKAGEAQEKDAGAAIYQQKCARCHGPSGEGAKEHPDPLIGKRSLEQLTRYIAKSMPEDAPGTCTGADAEKVAAFIFDAFYSPAAQLRKKGTACRSWPGLHRQRIPQCCRRFTFGTFRSGKPPVLPSRRTSLGLRRRIFHRQTQARFLPGRVRSFASDFGTTSPDFDKFKTDEMSANWQGSVLPEETGLYEFISALENIRLAYEFNDMKKAVDRQAG